MTCQEDQKGSNLEKLWRQHTSLASESERGVIERQREEVERQLVGTGQTEGLQWQLEVQASMVLPTQS